MSAAGYALRRHSDMNNQALVPLNLCTVVKAIPGALPGIWQFQ